MPQPANPRFASLRDNAPGLLLTLAVVAYGLWLYPSLPGQAAVHFDLRGIPDRYASRAIMVFLLPVLSIGVQLLVPLLLAASPADYRMENSGRTVGRIGFAIAILLGGIQCGLLEANRNPDGRALLFFIHLSFGLFLITLGNVLGKTERNFFIGIRTPWTLASERCWTATHRFAGRWMVGAGSLLTVSAFFAPSFAVAFAMLIIASVAPVAYSFWFDRHGSAVD